MPKKHLLIIIGAMILSAAVSLFLIPDFGGARRLFAATSDTASTISNMASLTYFDQTTSQQMTISSNQASVSIITESPTPTPTVSVTPTPTPTPTITIAPIPAPTVSTVAKTTNSSSSSSSNKKKDTDKDGLPDYYEKIWKTSLRVSDTDKDSYIDGEEVCAGYNPLGNGAQSPEQKKLKKPSNCGALYGYSMKAYTLTIKVSKAIPASLKEKITQDFAFVVGQNNMSLTGVNSSSKVVQVYLSASSTLSKYSVKAAFKAIANQALSASNLKVKKIKIK